MADHVKYITYTETKLDCKTPDDELCSWTFGKTLITVANIHNKILNVMKNM